MEILSVFSEVSTSWYQTLSGISAFLTEPLREPAFNSKIPFISALFFGIMGSLAPCQLSANLGAMAYLSKQAGEQKPLFREALAYLWGKILVYSVLGFVVLAIGYELPPSAMSWFRRLLGPVLILTGLYFLKVLSIKFTFGKGISDRLVQFSANRRGFGAFSLGAATSLAFCPTMALLFFGLMMPLAANSNVGMALPPVFAVGVALPLMLFTFVLSWGMSHAAAGEATGRFSQYMRTSAGIIFLLLGINDIFLYLLN